MLNMIYPQSNQIWWTLYLRTTQGDYFLQKSDNLESLRRANQASVNRWINQMGVTVRHAESAMLCLSRGKYMESEARYVAGGRRVWTQVTASGSAEIRDGTISQSTP